jgi:hypothetical protein
MPCAALERHPATSCDALRGIEVSVERKAESLQVAYVLDGDIERLRIPQPRAPRVAERLWEHTCCELFIARPDAPGYREFNLSPSGEWAAYAFTGYRAGRLPVPVCPRISVRRAAGRLQLEASIPTQEIARLSIGLSAVIEEKSGGISYWSLRHAPGKPDFHHPDAFALDLDEVRH